MALIINLDSTLENASVSVAKDGIILMEQNNDVQKEHAAFLHAAIKSLLLKLDISIKNIDAVATTIGPGSYTGLRVCLAAAKGLCYALNKPLITVGTLQAMAKTAILNNTGENDFLFCPMIDARRMEVYTGLYNINVDEIIAPHAEIIDEQFCSKFLKINKVLFCGNGMDKFKKINTDPNATFVLLPDITEAINLLSYDKFCGENFTDIVAASPLYTKDFYNL